MKKTKTILLTALTLFGLAACGGGQGNEAPANEGSGEAQPTETAESTETAETTEGGGDFAGKTLKVAGLDGGYGTDGWNAVIAKFEEMTGATVESKFEKNISEVLRPEIQSGNTPDVIYYSVGAADSLTETMVKEKMVSDISDLLDKQVPGEEQTVGEKLIPGFADTFVTNPYGDGKTYLAPLFYSPSGLWYNKAMFTEGGGKYELPTTMEEFLALGKEAEKDGVPLFTYPVAGYFDTFLFSLAYEVGGSELFDKLMNYDPEAWKNEATPMFEVTGEILKYLNPNTVSQANNESFTQNQLQVMKNEALFMPNGSWVVGEMADAEGVADGFEWGFMAMPSYEGSDRYAFSFFEQAFVPTDAQEPELAKEFLAYLYSDEAGKLFAENGGAIQPVQNYNDYITDEQSKVYYSVYDDAVKPALGSWAAAPVVEGVDMHKALFDTINSVATGEKTIEEWQNEVVDAATKIHDAIEAEK
ncbi:carbohydrate ABC transporter substrate-binding protein [Anaerococcus sp. AGMB09787]|uniref:carbohydrate ABC transporter substrate-binding protein n=1 Tax=Anaerococcus sp. AGMB09787 TaxID=2922869 RepID=UPI001FAF35C8|nr:carbohydrate ABC transporter substrate-binding protein [Anaerococcus sp. AGMB09787]